MSKQFVLDNKRFVLKLSFEGSDEGETRRIRVPRLTDDEGNLSYKKLADLAIQFYWEKELDPLNPVNQISDDDCQVKLTYYDVDSDLINISSTDELEDAIDQFAKQGVFFVRMFASIEGNRTEQEQKASAASVVEAAEQEQHGQGFVETMTMSAFCGSSSSRPVRDIQDGLNNNAGNYYDNDYFDYGNEEYGSSSVDQTDQELIEVVDDNPCSNADCVIAAPPYLNSSGDSGDDLRLSLTASVNSLEVPVAVISVPTAIIPAQTETAIAVSVGATAPSLEESMQVLVLDLQSQIEHCLKGMYATLHSRTDDMVEEENIYVREIREKIGNFVIAVRGLTCAADILQSAYVQIVIMFTMTLLDTLQDVDRVSEVEAEQLLWDVTWFKTIFLNLPIDWEEALVTTMTDTWIFTGIVQDQFHRIETLLFLIATPGDLLADAYQHHYFSSSSSSFFCLDDLHTVMALKGLKRREQAAVLQEIEKNLGNTVKYCPRATAIDPTSLNASSRANKNPLGLIRQNVCGWRNYFSRVLSSNRSDMMRKNVDCCK